MTLNISFNMKEYTITLDKNLESGEYVSRIVAVGQKNGITVSTPISANNGILHHVEEIKDILGIKFNAYYNKSNKK